MSVHLELAFQNIMQRQLSGGHTHLYTNESIDWMCQEYKFERSSEWWFAAILSIYTELSPCLWRARKTAARRPECGRTNFCLCLMPCRLNSTSGNYRRGASLVAVHDVSVNRVLVTGATGLLGPYVRAAFPDKEVVTTARKNSDWDCDLTDKAAARYLIQKVGPEAVVHLMALTDVDYCEANPQVAQMFNAESVDHIVAELEPDATLVYLSSDQVYPGDGGPYAEDAADPINVYGQSKLSGELAALRHANSLCLRANLFGPSRTEGRASLSDFVVEALRQKKPITLFQDILFSPLHMDTLARYVRRSIEEERRLQSWLPRGDEQS